MFTTNVETVLNVLDNVSASAEELHDAMVNLLAECAEASKKDVVESRELARVFAHSMRGLDRRRMLSWITTYTPIRPKFKDNGVFEKLSWSNAFVKAAKAAEVPTFDLQGAVADKWYDHEAARTTKVAKANLDRAVKALAKEAARAVFESEGKLGSVVDVLRNAVDGTDFVTAIINVMESDSFNAWAEERQADMEAAKRKAEQERTEKNQATLELVARCRAQLEDQAA